MLQKQNSLAVYTIGHSNVPAFKIVELMKKNDIRVLVDVRSSPYSKYVSQFNREMFQSVLQQAGIDYKFAGDYLGGRPKDPTCYKDGMVPDGHADFLHIVDYPAVMTKEWYQKGINRLLEIAGEQRTAIMCSEEDPARCHRQHLISQTLLKMGIEVLHIRGNGQIQKAWLLSEQKEEKQPERPAEQLDLLSLPLAQEEAKVEETPEPEMLYEPIEQLGTLVLFPDFLDESPEPGLSREKKKTKKTSNKKRDQQGEKEKELLNQWIEKAKRK